jgi:hypothetical protein
MKNHLNMKMLIALALASLGYASQSHSYSISIKNELDGPITVNITENKVTTPRQISAGRELNYNSVGCYILTLKVDAGNAVGQTGGVGTDAAPYCGDYKIRARFSTSRFWDPITGKESQALVIMDLVPM